MVSKAALAAQAAAEQRAASSSKSASSSHSPETLKMITKIATAKVASMEKDSQLFSVDAQDVIPKFAMDELTMGRVLGKGGFGTVKEIRSIDCKKKTDVSGPVAGDEGDQAHQDKKFIADHCIRDGGDARYCIKVRYCVVDMLHMTLCPP